MMNPNDRAITGFAMVGHGLVHTYELSIPILLTVWLVEFPVTSATLGTVVAVGYGLFGVGSLPGGILVDRFESRTLIVACLFGMGLSFLLLGALPGVAGITLALAVWGTAASVYHPAGLALISNGVEARGSGFAYHGMAGNVGIAGGPFGTALLLVAVDWRTAAAVLAVPALAAGAIGLAVDFDETAAVDPVADGGPAPGESDPPPESTADGGSAPTTDVGSLREFVAASRGLFTAGFATVFVLVLFNGLYYRGMLTFLPQLLSDFLDPLVGDATLGSVGPFSDGPLGRKFDVSQYLYAGLLAVGIGGQYVGGRLTEAVEPEHGLVVVLFTLVAIALLFVPASGSLVALLAVSLALGFALFALQPLSQATIAAYSPPGRRGLSFGFTYLAIFGVGALGASIVGAALTYGSPALVFLLLASFAGASSLLACSLVIRELR